MSAKKAHREEDDDRETSVNHQQQQSRHVAIHVGGAEEIEGAESHKRVVSFLKSIQPRTFKSKQKEAIAGFTNWYFDTLPHMTDTDIYLLLAGVEDKMKGLLDTCGNTNLKSVNSIKASSVAALELLLNLINPDTNTKHADQFLDVLSTVSAKHISAMKLDRHVLLDQSLAEKKVSGARARENAFKLAFKCMEQPRLAKLGKHVFFEDKQAEQMFNTWYTAIMSNPDSDDEKEKAPTRWSDIKLEPPKDEMTVGNVGQRFTQAVADEDRREEKDPLGLVNMTTKVFENKKKKKKKTAWHKIQKHLKEKEGGGGKIGTQQQQMYDTTKGSLSVFDRDFNPVLFLSEVHAMTPFEKLVEGLKKIREDVDRTEQKRTLVRENYLIFCNCLTTIHTFHKHLNTPVINKEGKQVDQVVATRALLQDAEQDAQQLYKPILTRKQEADRIRNTLVTLQRFKFIFSLPSTLRGYELDGRYDQCVRDYKKIKSLQLPKTGHVALLERVMKEVGVVVANIRKKLFRRLEDPSAPFSEQVKIFGYLSELDCEKDPARHYLSLQKEDIITHIQEIFTTHTARARAAENNELTALEIDFSYAFEKPLDRETVIHQMIVKLCTFLTRRMPQFLRLARLAQIGANEQKNDNKNKQMNSNSSIDESIKSIICSVSDAYANAFREGLFPLNFDQPAGTTPETHALSLSPLLPDNVHKTLKCLTHIFSSFETTKMPVEYLESHINLSAEISEFWITRVLKNSYVVISQLHAEETWEMASPVEQITRLPLRFKELMGEAIKALSLIPSPSPWMVEIMSAGLLECSAGFADALHCLAFSNNTSSSNISSQRNSNNNSVSEINEQAVVSSKEQDRRILLVLSNTFNTSGFVLPSLWERFRNTLPPNAAALLKDATDHTLELLDTLEDMCSALYVQKKALVLNAFISKSQDRRQEMDKEPPVAIRGYMYDVLLELTTIHRELFLIQKALDGGDLLQQIVEQVCRSLLLSIQRTPNFNPFDAVQLLLEMTFLKRTLNTYVGERADRILTELMKLLDGFSKGSWRGGSPWHTISKHADDTTRAMFECFKQGGAKVKKEETAKGTNGDASEEEY